MQYFKHAFKKFRWYIFYFFLANLSNYHRHAAQGIANLPLPIQNREKQGG